MTADEAVRILRENHLTGPEWQRLHASRCNTLDRCDEDPLCPFAADCLLTAAGAR